MSQFHITRPLSSWMATSCWHSENTRLRSTQHTTRLFTFCSNISAPYTVHETRRNGKGRKYFLYTRVFGALVEGDPAYTEYFLLSSIFGDHVGLSSRSLASVNYRLPCGIEFLMTKSCSAIFRCSNGVWLTDDWTNRQLDERTQGHSIHGASIASRDKRVAWLATTPIGWLVITM